jgi:drug/metabolite transporter (DMT)-like permease
MSDVPAWWWIVFTLLAATGQTFRNAAQKNLTATLGTIGATHVRFLFGMPFGLLFLVCVMLATGRAFPALSGSFAAWLLFGALSQIAGTALLLSAMKLRSFVVATAYAKTEPVQLALLGLVFLGDRLSWPTVTAILIATVGVMLMSRQGVKPVDYRSVGFGLLSGAMFAFSAIGFRGAILALDSPSFVVNATVTLALGQVLQSAILTSYLLWRSPATLREIFKAWRPSTLAGFMGAFASQMWFLAFAIEAAARVRTLALIEILFAQALSRKLFAQGTSWREGLGIGLVVVGVVILLNG